MAENYQPSGKYSLGFLINFVVVAAIVMPVLALLYTYLIWYIPIIYINLFITFGFGTLAGLALAYGVVKKGVVRNTTIALLVGVVGALIAIYVSWAVWVDLVVNSSEHVGSSRIGVMLSNINVGETLSLILQPKVLWQLVNEINVSGTWGIRSSTVSGGFLWFIWVAEFITIFATAVSFTYGEAMKPYSEADQAWHQSLELPAMTFIESTDQFFDGLQKGTAAVFDAFELVDGETQSHSVLTLYLAEEGVNYLSVINKTAEEDKKGEVKFSDEYVLRYLSISKQQAQVLQEKSGL